MMGECIWADNLFIRATALVLKVDIYICGMNATRAKPWTIIYGHSNSSPIYLGWYYEQINQQNYQNGHYQSVLPMEVPLVNVDSTPRNSTAVKPTYADVLKKDKDNQVPVTAPSPKRSKVGNVDTIQTKKGKKANMDSQAPVSSPSPKRSKVSYVDVLKTNKDKVVSNAGYSKDQDDDLERMFAGLKGIPPSPSSWPFEDSDEEPVTIPSPPVSEISQPDVEELVDDDLQSIASQDDTMEEELTPTPAFETELSKELVASRSLHT